MLDNSSAHFVWVLRSLIVFAAAADVTVIALLSHFFIFVSYLLYIRISIGIKIEIPFVDIVDIVIFINSNSNYYYYYYYITTIIVNYLKRRASTSNDLSIWPRPST